MQFLSEKENIFQAERCLEQKNGILSSNWWFIYEMQSFSRLHQVLRDSGTRVDDTKLVIQLSSQSHREDSTNNKAVWRAFERVASQNSLNLPLISLIRCRFRAIFAGSSAPCLRTINEDGNKFVQMFYNSQDEWRWESTWQREMDGRVTTLGMKNHRRTSVKAARQPDGDEDSFLWFYRRPNSVFLQLRFQAFFIMLMFRIINIKSHQLFNVLLCTHGWARLKACVWDGNSPSSAEMEKIFWWMSRRLTSHECISESKLLMEQHTYILTGKYKKFLALFICIA